MLVQDYKTNSAQYHNLFMYLLLGTSGLDFKFDQIIQYQFLPSRNSNGLNYKAKFKVSLSHDKGLLFRQVSLLSMWLQSNTKENFVLAPFLATFRAKFCGYGYVVRHPVNSDFFNSLSVNKVCNTLAALIEQLKLKFHIWTCRGGLSV